MRITNNRLAHENIYLSCRLQQVFVTSTRLFKSFAERAILPGLQIFIVYRNVDFYDSATDLMPRLLLIVTDFKEKEGNDLKH
jgi:hypothetical protein